MLLVVGRSAGSECRNVEENGKTLSRVPESLQIDTEHDHDIVIGRMSLTSYGANGLLAPRHIEHRPTMAVSQTVIDALLLKKKVDDVCT